MIPKKKKIINYFMGVDVGSIMVKLLWFKCYKCKNNREDYQGVELYTNDFICYDCIHNELLEILSCSKCIKYYIKDINKKCTLCRTNCLVYCSECLYEKYYVK